MKEDGSNMRVYLVTCYVLCGDNGRYLVKANNKKEAINKVWIKYYVPKNSELIANGFDPYYKKDLDAQSINNLFNDNEELEIVKIW